MWNAIAEYFAAPTPTEPTCPDARSNPTQPPVSSRFAFLLQKPEVKEDLPIHLGRSNSKKVHAEKELTPGLFEEKPSKTSSRKINADSIPPRQSQDKSENDGLLPRMGPRSIHTIAQENLLERTLRPRANSHHSYRAEITLGSEFFVAGTKITGTVKLNSRGNVWVRSVALGLVGEEITRGGRRPFLHSHCLMHDPSKRNTNCVEAEENTYNSEYKLAAKQAVIPFAFSLPDILPTSVESVGGSVRYVVTCVAEIMTGRRQLTFSSTKRVTVLERFSKIGEYSGPVEEQALKSLSFRPGEIHLRASIPKKDVLSGIPLHVSVQVKNTTLKKVKSMEISLLRTVNHRTEALTSCIFKEKWDAGERRSGVFTLNIPQKVHSVRHTALLHSQSCLEVKLKLGLVTAPLKVVLPITVYPLISAYPPLQMFKEEPLHPNHFNRIFVPVDDNSNPIPPVHKIDPKRRQMPWESTICCDEDDSDSEENFQPRHPKKKSSFIPYRSTQRRNVFSGCTEDELREKFEYRVSGNLPKMREYRITVLNDWIPEEISPLLYKEPCQRKHS